MSCAQFKLDMFEGPLDLLLHLITKHKLNIHDIEISLLLEQYMEYIHQLDHEDLEDAADFLEMAARLIYIKTVSLLPQDEEAQELKKDLEGRLIEYSQCKCLAQILAKTYAGGEIFVRKPVQIPVDKTYTREHDPMILFEAYLGLSEKARSEKPINAKLFQPIVSYKVVSVGSKIVYILKRLYTVGVCDLSHIYDGMQTKSERVATFLAILELTKSGRIVLNDDNTQISFSDKSRERKKHSVQNNAERSLSIPEQACVTIPAAQPEQHNTEPEPEEQIEIIPEQACVTIPAAQPEQHNAEPEPEEQIEIIPEQACVTIPAAQPEPKNTEPEQEEQIEIIPEQACVTIPAAQPEQHNAEPEPEEQARLIDELPEFRPDESVHMPEERKESDHRSKQPQPKPLAERIAVPFEITFPQPVTEDKLPEPQPLAEDSSEPTACDNFFETTNEKTAFKPNYWGRLKYYWGCSPVGDDISRNYWKYGSISQ